MMGEKYKFETDEKNEENVREDLNVIGCEKVSQTVNIHNFQIACQKNRKTSLGRNTSHEFQSGKYLLNYSRVCIF